MPTRPLHDTIAELSAQRLDHVRAELDRAWSAPSRTGSPRPPFGDRDDDEIPVPEPTSTPGPGIPGTGIAGTGVSGTGTAGSGRPRRAAASGRAPGGAARRAADPRRAMATPAPAPTLEPDATARAGPARDLVQEVLVTDAEALVGLEATPASEEPEAHESPEPLGPLEPPEPPGASWGAAVRRRLGGFERPHVAVVALLALIGVVVAVGLAVRARPITIAAAAPPATSPTLTSPTTNHPGTSHPGGGPPGAASSTGGAPSSAQPQIVVHVIGAVRHPGLVTLPEGSRVDDAITAAGGTTSKARLGTLNLAQVLVDAQQVIVGHGDVASEVRGPSGAGPGPADPGAGPSGAQPAEPLDLNAATVDQLDALPGVGPVTAAAIVAWRAEHGRFSDVAELQEIDGIGPKTFERLAPLVRV